MKTIIKDVQGLVASLFPSIHRVAAPSHRRLRRIATALLCLLTIGVGDVWGAGQYNLNWQGKVYFRVPDSWDLSTYSTVQVAVSRTTSASTSNHIEYIGTMTRVGTTRLYYCNVSANHNGWNQNEFILFTANSSSYSSGSFTISTNHYYTTPLDYGCNNSSNYYLFNPSSDSNGANVTGSYNSTRDGLLKKTQTVNLYTNGSSSKTGGSVQITGIYLTGNTTTNSSDITNGSSTSASYGAAIGSTVTLTATPNTGYEFQGWFNAASGGSAVSTNTTYSYTCKDAKTLYARFAPITYTITYNNMSGATNHASNPSSYTVASSAITLQTPTKTGYFFGGWYTNPGLTTAAGSPAIAAGSTGNKTFYAKWTEITITDVTVSPSTGGTGNITMTVSFKTNVPRSSGYYYRIAEFGGSGTGSVGGGFYINGQVITSGDASTLITTSPFTPNFGSSGVYTAAIQVYTDGPVVVQKTYYFTYGAGNYYTVSFNMNGHGSSISSQSVLSGGTATRPSPDPTATGYTFGGWYQESTCTNIWNFSTAITADRILYAKWTPKTTTVTLNRQSGTGGSASVTATYDADMPSATMPTRANYNFAGYYSGTGGTGTKYYNADGTSAHTWDFEDATKTLYAYWTEKTYTVNVSCSNPAATSGAIAYNGGGLPVDGNIQVGNVTTVMLTASAAYNTGYTAGRWTLSGGVTLESGELTDLSIGIRATATGTAVYTYAEVLTTGVYLCGTFNNNGESDAGWSSEKKQFMKRTGESTGNLSYVSIHLSPSDFTNNTLEVKVLPSENNWHGNNGTYTVANSGTDWQMGTGDGYTNNLKVTVSVEGDYVFRWNSSTYNLSITYPTVNQLQIYSASPADATNTQNFDWEGSGTTLTKSLNLNAETTYQFKVVNNSVHLGNTGTMTATNHSNWTMSSSVSNNCQIATTVAGTYTFSFNTSTNKLTVTYPTIPAMTGTLSFASSQPGKVCGLGTNESPFLVFQGETLTLTATHTSPPATETDHIWYQYTVNSTAQTAKQGDLTFTPTTSATTSNIPFTVKSYYQYGPTGYKVNGESITSETYYYKVIPRPTVTISSITSQVEVGKNFTFDIATTNTNVSCLLGNGPWFTRQYQKWNGSSWGAWTDADATPITDASTLAMANEGFYQWRIKMNYGGTTPTGGSEFYSTPVQNVIYKPCQVTITDAVGWFKGVYAYRETDDFDESLCSHHNGTYPGEYFKKSCVEVGDNTWIYIFKYPIYTHIILNENTSSTANRTEAIPITQKTCIEITGEKFQATNNWAFTKTENCGDVYYRVQTTYTPNSTTYYSNIVKKGSAAPLSFFAAASGSGTLTWQKLEDGVWSNQSTLSSPPQSGVYQADYNGNAGISGITQYEGKLYIRTDAAAGGWEEYINEDNEMNHFTPRSNYDYYWVTYTGDKIYRNIDAEIGNTINKCLARRIEDRNVYADAEGKVYEKNVRFSYDSQNNWFDYAVIGASTNTSYTFLSTYGADAQGATTSTKVFKLTDSQEKGTATKENDPNNQVKFSDLSNWVYQADVWAVADGTNAVTIAIEARLPGLATVQQIVDRAQPLTTLGATTTAGPYIIRILYDYKTNTITTGWLPKDNTSITTPTTIAGNMILNRGETTSVEQLTLSDGVTVSGLRKLYMALKLDKSNLTNGESFSGSYIHYIWFSLPYDCKVSDIFGAPGEYPDDWEIWEYDGAKRAREGLLDNASFFETVPFDGTLQANTGYCLGLLLNENRFKTIVMDDVARSSIYIYFPSEVDGYTLRNSANKQLVVPAQYDETFFKRRPDREKYDRDWNLVGVPSYNDITTGISATDQDVEHTHEAASAPGFIYDYVYTGGDAGSSENNKYKYKAVNAGNGFKYKAFYSYMMQYAGTISWSSNSIENIKAAPRKPVRTGEHQLTQATLNLQLLANDEWLDNTFVSLLPQATDKVDHNIDLVKIWNSGSSQLCSLAEDVELAANCLSVDSQTVDLRVYIDNTRTYTFRLEEKVPDGLIALLEDTEAHTLTDLGSDAYTVDLMQGTYDARFRLHLIVGSSDIGTDIDQLTNSMSYTLYGNELLLNALTEPVRAALYDPAGRLLYQGIVNPGNTINLPDQAGVYLLRLPTQTLRIVK